MLLRTESSPRAQKLPLGETCANSGSMYHSLVHAQVRQLFDVVNQGKAGPLFRLFAGRSNTHSWAITHVKDHGWRSRELRTCTTVCFGS